MSIRLPQILRPRPPTTPSRRLKSDPRVHDIVVYPLFCEGLICSFMAGEGLDRGEIAEQVAAFLIGLPPHLVVVSERVFQPRSERSRTVVDLVKPVTDKGSSATNSKFSSAAISIHLEENAAAASRKRKLASGRASRVEQLRRALAPPAARGLRVETAKSSASPETCGTLYRDAYPSILSGLARVNRRALTNRRGGRDGVHQDDRAPGLGSAGTRSDHGRRR